MRKILLPLSAFAMMLPASFAAVATPAGARTHHRHYYHGTTYRHYRTCRHSPGNTGLIAGGVAGGVVGSQVLGHGLLGIGAGAVGGALAGRAIDRGVSARYRCR